MMNEDVKILNQNGTEWVVDKIKSREPVIFKGTQSEWDALTAEEQAKYTVRYHPDIDTGDVVDAVTDGDMHAVTSNAVFDAILNNVKKGKYTSKGVCNYNGKTYFVPDEYAGGNIKLLVFYVNGENNCLGLCCVNGADISGFSYVDGTLNNLEYIIYNGTNNTPAFKVSNDSGIPVAVFELGLGY